MRASRQGPSAIDAGRIRVIDGLEARLSGSGDDQLRDHARRLRRRVAEGAILDDVLCEMFALARVAATRGLGQRPRDGQMLAGLALHRGKVAEMPTGEGKTLAAVAPAALAALEGRGVHVLTFNDYLARRDAAWMGLVYERLGLTVGCIQETMTPRQRRRAYRCDVTYLTVKEAGFDHLRDGLCLDAADQVHRPFHMALVDEADSLLIDEARIPLVIAGSVDDPEGDLDRLARVARGLRRPADYDTDDYGRNVFLTDRGARRAEPLLGCGDLFDAGRIGLLTDLRNALHAEALLRRDIDYIVRDGRVELVDEMTGRVAVNRHWPDGLQAAVEAKEGVLPRPEGRILGSMTIQHLLLAYPRLCGMTATARPAARELADVYGLEVVAIPPHRPCRRVDHPDEIFATKEAKHGAVIEEVLEVHSTGRPVLVGTLSVEESEKLAGRILDLGVRCRVLNARNDAEEAAIIAEAGAPGAVTLSTNMAGRGTDIRLGGSSEEHRRRVVGVGGLHVIGTNRHDSRRIDDQLRGRAGRQGDPGSSRFFVSLEDDLPRRYRIDRLLPSRLLRPAEEETRELPAQPVMQREVERVQRIAEGQHADIRRRLLIYSRLIERQRAHVQGWRREVLEGTGPAGFLAEASARRWARLCSDHGAAMMESLERRLTLLAIDRCWSDHLGRMQALRDEVHLAAIAGRVPVDEFHRRAGAAFESLYETIDHAIVEDFDRIAITDRGIDWRAEGLLGPSSTWTYLVDDNVFAGNAFMTLANRPSLGLWAVLTCWPILLIWGLVLRWRRARR